MNESLLSPSNIILFGRDFPLKFDQERSEADMDEDKNRENGKEREREIVRQFGANRFLRDQLTAPGAKLARIYAFTYEGTFYNLPKPTVFLVHGPGLDISGFAENTNKLFSDIGKSGVVARDFGFEHGVKFWEYDKADFTLRCDIVSGTFDEVLLDAALSMTARDSITSRSDLAARSDLASRSDAASRSDLTSRSDLALRHRLKG